MNTHAPRVSELSLVIPVYNSAESLPLLGARLEAVLPTLSEAYEVVLVDDGSRDGSWAAIQSLIAQYPWARGIRLMRNYGQHNALLCGIRAACHPIICTIDDDLQNPPEEIVTLLSFLDGNADVVYGTPQKETHGLWRDLASQITKLTLQGVMGAATASEVSAFRVFRTHLREAFASYNSPYVSIDVLLTWGTSRFTAVRVRQDPRQIGTSNYTFRTLLLHALNMLTGFSTVPLRAASMLGFAFTLAGVAILLFVLIRYLLSGTTVPGFPFLASVIAVFSGVQLFSLGIIGEYLARMHFRMLEKPAYTVHETTRTMRRAQQDGQVPHGDTCAAFEHGTAADDQR